MQLLVVWGRDEDIVHINEDATRIFVLKYHEDLIHGALEHRGGVGHPEKHYLRGIGAFGQLERQLPLVFMSYADVIISIPDVQRRE